MFSYTGGYSNAARFIAQSGKFCSFGCSHEDASVFLDFVFDLPLVGIVF